MKATVRPEHQLLAVEGEHDVHCLFEVAVPELGDDAGRPPLNLALAIDRSGSMAGAKLETARRCAAWLAERLCPEDRLAIVDFDDEARLLRPLAPVAAVPAAAALARIAPGGSTNLSGGWLKALEQVRTAHDGEPRRILLLTDGMANVGITDPAALVTMAGSAAAEGASTTTIGFGDGFDEDLLTAMADAGMGGSHWAENPDAAPAIFAREFDGLTRLVAQNLSLEIRPRDDVEVLSILNEYPQVPVAAGVQVQLGDAYGGEVRRVVFALHIPRLAELGAATVADLVLRYVSVGDEVASHEITLPVVVNAVSAAEAAAAAGDAAVTEQVTLLKAARARDEAIRRADEGDAAGARDALHSASLDLRAAGLTDEATALDAEVFDLADALPSPAQRKRMRYDSYSRRRGR
jgi:Ca-activated chloride channel homolog